MIGFYRFLRYFLIVALLVGSNFLGAINASIYSIDFSDTVDAQIGSESELDSVESNLKFWIDATNIDGSNNSTLSDGAAISSWQDLSGSEAHAENSEQSYRPKVMKNAYGNNDAVDLESSYLDTQLAGHTNYNVTMFFVFDKPQVVKFWMKNTSIPLDIIFADSTGVVKKIQYDTIPYDESLIFGGSNIQFVLEILSGKAKVLKIEVGTELKHPLIKINAAWPCNAIK